MAFSIFPQRERSTVQRSTATQNRGNSLTDNPTGTPIITLENAEDILHYIPQYKVIICSQHCSAVRNVARHLQEYHFGDPKDKSAISRQFRQYEVLSPALIQLPPPLELPFDLLGKPKNAFICDEEECGFISINRSEIAKHCNKTHLWRSSKADREHWHHVFVQTFFSSGGFQKYFTVDYNEQRGGQGQPSGLTLQHNDQVNITLIEEE